MTVPLGINDHETLVGYDYQTPKNSFIYQDGVFQPLGFPRAQYTYADAVNNSGQVVGYFVSSNGTYHSFTWTASAVPARK